MSDFYGVWVKKMKNNGTYAQSSLKHSRYLYSKEFSNDPSFRAAKLYKTDLSQTDIGIRISNLDKSTLEKRIQLNPIIECTGGEYIQTDDKTYIVTEYEGNTTIPYAIATECPLTLNWYGLEMPPIPCVLTNSSYGSKGEVHNYIQQGDFDSRGVILVQKNKYTNIIYEGMRFIFLNNNHDVYEVTKKQSVFTPGCWQLVCKYTKSLPEDDFEHNIAYNKRLFEDNDINNVRIIGDSVISYETNSKYTTEGFNYGSIQWELDQETQSLNNCEILEQDNSHCIIVMHKNNFVDNIQLIIRDENGKFIDKKDIKGTDEAIGDEDRLWDF